MLQLEGGIGAVPAQHAQRGQVARLLVEVGKGDLALVAAVVAEGGDEQQIVRYPGRGRALVGRRALLEHQVAQDAPQHHHRHPFALELDEEDAPRLAAGQRPQLVDRLDLGRVLVLEAQFGRRVLEGQFVEAVFLPAASRVRLPDSAPECSGKVMNRRGDVVWQ